MKVVNSPAEDHHLHTSDYSDGLMSVYDLVGRAGEIGLTKIAITDHSQAALNKLGLTKRIPRYAIDNFKDPWGRVQVVIGVEADLLNEQGDICDFVESEDEKKGFIILSTHQGIYPKEQQENLTAAYIKAIERHGSRIDVLGHLPVQEYISVLDIAAIIKAANSQGIALELNCKYLQRGLLNQSGLMTMLRTAERVYVNSDAHNLHVLQTVRTAGWEFLKQEGFI